MDLSTFTILFVCSIAFGSIIGAYLGTAEYRIRHHEPLITSQCFCPQCHHPLSALHQIPVLSWLALRGRCHYCQAPIPKRYLWIEGGFMLYYGTIFLLLWKHPFLILFFWYGLVLAVLLVRCHSHLRHMLQGLAIFTAYHGIYGIVFLAVYASLRYDFPA